MQCPHSEEADKNRSQRKAYIENELLNQICLEDDDAVKEDKQQQGC